MIYLQLLLSYLKIGFFGFGGGYAMLSLIQNEVVAHHGWITASQFTDIVALSQMTPADCHKQRHLRRIYRGRILGLGRGYRIGMPAVAHAHAAHNTLFHQTQRQPYTFRAHSRVSRRWS